MHHTAKLEKNPPPRSPARGSATSTTTACRSSGVHGLTVPLTSGRRRGSIGTPWKHRHLCLLPMLDAHVPLMVNQLAEFLKIGVVQVLDVPKISQDPAGGTAVDVPVPELVILARGKSALELLLRRGATGGRRVRATPGGTSRRYSPASAGRHTKTVRGAEVSTDPGADRGTRRRRWLTYVPVIMQLLFQHFHHFEFLKVPQVQFIDRVLDIPVETQRKDAHSTTAGWFDVPVGLSSQSVPYPCGRAGW